MHARRASGPKLAIASRCIAHLMLPTPSCPYQRAFERRHARAGLSGPTRLSFDCLEARCLEAHLQVEGPVLQQPQAVQSRGRTLRAGQLSAWRRAPISRLREVSLTGASFSLRGPRRLGTRSRRARQAKLAAGVGEPDRQSALRPPLAFRIRSTPTPVASWRRPSPPVARDT